MSAPRPARPSEEAERAPSGEELVEAIRSGDSAAWRELVLRYEPLVLSVARRVLPSPEDVEDVYQATWKTVYEHMQSIRNPGRIAAWIATTARRESWRVGRARAARSLGEFSLEDLTGDSSPSTPPDVVSAGLDDFDRIVRALEQMDSRCRTMLTRLFLDGDTPSYAELGRELDLPVGSIGPTRIRCLEKLADILEARDA